MNEQMPNLLVSDSEKQQSSWYKSMYDYTIAKAQSVNNRDYTEENLNAANGIVSKNTFEEVLRPFQADGSKLKDLPGEIRDTDFITPIREKNMGEYIELPYKFFTTVSDADAVMQRSFEVQQQILDMLQEEFIKIVEASQQGETQVELPDFKELAEKKMADFFDEKAIKSQNTLKLINSLTDFDRLRIQSFFYWWATEEFYTIRTIENGEIIKKTISPLNAYPIPNGEDFVEDYDAFVYTEDCSYQQFLESYVNDDNFDKEELEYIRQITVDSKSGRMSIPLMMKNRFEAFDNIPGRYVDNNSRLEFVEAATDLQIFHVFFKAFSPVKELVYLDAMGGEHTAVVPKDYVLLPEAGDIELRNIWIPKVYYGMRYGVKESGMYTKPKLLDVQRYDPITNKCKLPIGGKKGILDGIALNPIPRRLLPHLALDRILLLRIDREISKYQPYITQLPQSMINPDEIGTTIEKVQHIKADNTLIVDDQAIDNNILMQGLRVIQMPAVEGYINTLWNIRSENRAEAWDVANMNNERFGNAPTQQTVSNANQNIYRAKLGSVLMITSFNAALQREHMADLEFSKIAYANGKTGTFYDNREGQWVDVEIDPVEHIRNQYGIFVVNSKVEETLLQQYKDFAFAAAQNGENSLAIEAIDADHVPFIKQALRRADEAKKEYERWVQEQENNRAQAELEGKQASEQAERDVKERIADKQNATTIEAKYIDVQIASIKKQANDADTNNDGIVDYKDGNDSYKRFIDESRLRLEKEYLELDKRKQTHTEKIDFIASKQKDRDLVIKAKKAIARPKTAK
jgi:hypothetical protein